MQNVIKAPSDLLLLKHAQGFYGADKAVASRLVSCGVCTEAELEVAPGDFVVLETKGAIAPKRVLFLGAPPLRSFNYNEMELFARRAVEKIADLGLPVRVLTTTVHGVGYGLDGGEAIQRLIKGFQAGFSKQHSASVESITFLTLREREEQMLNSAIEAMAIRSTGLSAEAGAAEASDRASGNRQGTEEPATRPSAGKGESVPHPMSPRTRTVSKRRVFVAMPFSEEFQNVYDFGIYPAVRQCGLICERVDETHFTGDVLGRIKGGIEAADLVIADLTEGRPNVYLEVGYAWGRRIPVIFVAKKGEKLHFDVSTHRCIFYGRFTQFAKELEELIQGIIDTHDRS